MIFALSEIVRFLVLLGLLVPKPLWVRAGGVGLRLCLGVLRTLLSNTFTETLPLLSRERDRAPPGLRPRPPRRPSRPRDDRRVDERDPDLLPFRCERCVFRCRSLLPPLRCLPEGLPLDFREPFPNERGVDLCSRDFERITSRGC